MYRTFATTLACIANNTGIYYLKIREKQAATSFRYLTELEFVSPYIGLDPAACDPATIPPQPIPSFPVATGVAIRTSSQAIYLEWHDRQPFFGSISPSQWHIRTDVETSTFVQIGAGDFGMERYSLGLSFSVSHSTRARLRISDVAFAQPTIHASIESSEFAYPSGTSQSFELPRVGGIIFRTCGRLHRREVQVYGWCIVHRPSLVEPLFAWWDSLTFTVRFILPGYVLSHNEATAKLGVMCGHVDQLNDKLPVLTLPSGFTRRCLKYTIADRLPLVFRVPAFSACACRYSGFAGRLTSRISPYRSSCEPDTKIPHELIVRTAAEEALNSYGPAIGFPSSESFFHFSLTTYQDLKTEDIMRIECVTGMPRPVTNKHALSLESESGLVDACYARCTQHRVSSSTMDYQPHSHNQIEARTFSKRGHSRTRRPSLSSSRSLHATRSLGSIPKSKAVICAFSHRICTVRAKLSRTRRVDVPLV
ncbi:unnamed protein product [Peniophora sp. CBMAI 1063]|nr:unnamed protein product [Peniophora sp. CBMAI 1063]